MLDIVEDGLVGETVWGVEVCLDDYFCRVVCVDGSVRGLDGGGVSGGEVMGSSRDRVLHVEGTRDSHEVTERGEGRQGKILGDRGPEAG